MFRASNSDSIANPFPLYSVDAPSPDLRLAHAVKGGRQVSLEISRDVERVCSMCWYGECERCLKGEHESDKYEPYRQPCECVHWWAALNIGDNYFEIRQKEEEARKALANGIRNKGPGVRKRRESAA